ncbi:tripartite motif-containing protein 3-like isoform X2 [Drosophila busckii]|uniref:tripartite motif-containing protein 3-like isoform X2 n=1 Tax=Drosophila busckii TaxID=30019 RepID=UPI00083F48E9|nr:tripartite motif-containing protein 3-like isoform X2 [Drosophila busckii]
MPDCEFCAFCLMPKEQPVVIQCKHSFCQLCMENYCKAVTTNRRCPLCRQAFAFYESTAGILTITVLDSDDEDPDDDSSYDDDNGQPLQVNMLPAIAESPMESSESFSTADEASNWSESSNGYATPRR